MLDRAIFFREVRPLFNGRLSQSQVDGFNVVLDVWEESFLQRTPLTQLAVCLATMKWETASTMQPVHEYGDRAYFMRMYDKTGSRPNVAATLGNTEVGDGARYAGRGDVQLTGRANYRKMTKVLRDLGLIGADVDFEKDPEKVRDPRIAALIMFVGMEGGHFTGKSLDSIVDDKIDGDEHADFLRSRAIINGKDRDKEIAKIAEGMLKALVAAWKDGPAPVVVTAPVQPPAPIPAPAPVVIEAPQSKPMGPPPAEPGWFDRLLASLRSGRK